MVVSTPTPWCTAAMLAPLAEVGDDHAAVGRVAVERAQLLQDVLVGEAVEPVARHARRPRGPAGGRYICATWGIWRWKAVSKQATCGTPG